MDYSHHILAYRAARREEQKALYRKAKRKRPHD